MPRKTEELFALAESENLDVDAVELRSHILGFYLRHPALDRPCIGIRRDLYLRQCSTFRTVLAEEIFHHHTARGNSLRIITYADLMITRQDEWRARRDAADFMCPIPRILARLQRGYNMDELAEWFGVRIELIQFQLERVAATGAMQAG